MDLLVVDLKEIHGDLPQLPHGVPKFGKRKNSFCRVHKSRRVTAAKITDHIWSLREHLEAARSKEFLSSLPSPRPAGI
jgi:hypothetical protein